MSLRTTFGVEEEYSAVDASSLELRFQSHLPGPTRAVDRPVVLEEAVVA